MNKSKASGASLEGQLINGIGCAMSAQYSQQVRPVDNQLVL